MSEPTSTDDASVGPPERLHPFFLLTGLGGSLRGMAGGYALIGYLVVSGKWGRALFAMLALLLFMAIGVFLYWRRFEFRVGANEIRIDSGIVSRTHRSIPFDRIQDVDITQGPLARVLGLARVKFETGASGGEEEGLSRQSGWNGPSSFEISSGRGGRSRQSLQPSQRRLRRRPNPYIR